MCVGVGMCPYLYENVCLCVHVHVRRRVPLFVCEYVLVCCCGACLYLFLCLWVSFSSRSSLSRRPTLLSLHREPLWGRMQRSRVDAVSPLSFSCACFGLFRSVGENNTCLLPTQAQFVRLWTLTHVLNSQLFSREVVAENLTVSAAASFLPSSFFSL